MARPADGRVVEDAGLLRATFDAYRRALRRHPVDLATRHSEGLVLCWQGHTRAAKKISNELVTINLFGPFATHQLDNMLFDRRHTRDYHEAEPAAALRVTLGRSVHGRASTTEPAAGRVGPRVRDDRLTGDHTDALN